MSKATSANPEQRNTTIEKLFTEFTQNPEILPYNVDQVAETFHTIVQSIDEDLSVAEVGSIATKHTQASIPMEVINHVEEYIADVNYNQDPFITLLCLMNEHARYCNPTGQNSQGLEQRIMNTWLLTITNTLKLVSVVRSTVRRAANRLSSTQRRLSRLPAAASLVLFQR